MPATTSYLFAVREQLEVPPVQPGSVQAKILRGANQSLPGETLNPMLLHRSDSEHLQNSLMLIEQVQNCTPMSSQAC